MADSDSKVRTMGVKVFLESQYDGESQKIWKRFLEIPECKKMTMDLAQRLIQFLIKEGRTSRGVRIIIETEPERHISEQVSDMMKLIGKVIRDHDIDMAVFEVDESLDDIAIGGQLMAAVMSKLLDMGKMDVVDELAKSMLGVLGGEAHAKPEDMEALIKGILPDLESQRKQAKEFDPNDKSTWN
jgi:hypothetical protein